MYDSIKIIFSLLLINILWFVIIAIIINNYDLIYVWRATHVFRMLRTSYVKRMIINGKRTKNPTFWHQLGLSILSRSKDTKLFVMIMLQLHFWHKLHWREGNNLSMHKCQKCQNQLWDERDTFQKDITEQPCLDDITVRRLNNCTVLYQILVQKE